MKYNLACGPKPFHSQHLNYMGDLKDWTFVDLYCKDPDIKNWDATKLDEVPDRTADEIYASHFLEHIPHVLVPKVLDTWYSKLKYGGKIYINVPDLEWAAKRLYHYSQGQLLDGYYHRFDGEHGLLSILYGSQSHEGEYHKSGFVESYLRSLLREAGFQKIEVNKVFEAHEMGCLIAEGIK